jgi:putative NADH-flavin reductase
MKIVVFGAMGKTGKAIVAQALERHYEVTAFVRDASGYSQAGVRVVEGDVLDRSKVEQAVAGQDAVLDAIGGKTPWKQTELEQGAAGNIINAMQRMGVRRLVATSAMGVGDSGEVAGFFYEKILVPTLLRGSTQDKSIMESEVEVSYLDWILIRPAALTDDEPTGNVRVYTTDTKKKAHKISRQDVAAFMLAQLTSDTYLRQAVTIATE